MTKAPLLSSNDIACAAMACGLAISWHKGQPHSGVKRAEIAKLTALIDKLDKAGRHLNPYEHSDDMPLDWGDDPIYGPLPAQGIEARQGGDASCGSVADESPVANGDAPKEEPR